MHIALAAGDGEGAIGFRPQRTDFLCPVRRV